MCGIAGVVGGDGSWAVRRMCELLTHRGPDSDGFYEAPGVQLGMRRLAIMDVAHGDQPAFSEDGEVAVVFNGEIYNTGEVRDSLQGQHRFASHSDTECIPHLYEEYGPAFPERLSGMFAIALWDARQQTLELSVDRLGKKPLYYAVRGQKLYFASELHALVHGSGLQREVDPVALGQFLRYRYVPAPLSAVKGINRLPPAHRLTFRAGHVEVTRYWSLPSIMQAPMRDPVLEFRERLLEATRNRMLGERPMGAFLSGGLDSSAVVAAMTRVSDQTVKTFTVRFAGDQDSEAPVAARIAAHLGTEHHELTVSADVTELLPMLVRHVGNPLADPSLIPTYAVSRAAREHIVVALSGDGGDETWGGYEHYLRSRDWTIPTARARKLSRLAGCAAAGSGPARSAFSRVVSSALLRASEPDPAIRYARFMSVFRPEDWPALVRPEWQAATSEHDHFAYLAEVFRTAHGEAADRMMYTDIVSYLPGDLLTKVDVASMACSLEVRSPLLDHTMVEWAATLPAYVKLAGGRTKAVMREALRPWLPQGVVDLPKKGFGVPLDRWLRGPLRPMIDDILLDREARVKQYLQGVTVDRLAQDPGPRGGLRLWSLLVLELFLREVVE